MRIEPMQPADYPAMRKLSESLGRNSRPELFGKDECQLVLKNSQGQLVGWGERRGGIPMITLRRLGTIYRALKLIKNITDVAWPLCSPARD